MFTVEYYTKSNGQIPVMEWLGTLDNTTIARVLARLNRVAVGHFGDHKFVRDGVWELRFDIGPGYRVYYARVDAAIILLLEAGDKSSQRRDISAAVVNLEDYRSRNP